MQSVKLNLIPGSVMPVVNVSQYDKARQFALVIYEGASQYSLTGKSVQIRGTKPDGNGFAYDSTDGVVSVSGSTVTISTTQQMTAAGGQTMAELRITQSGVILGTLNFILMVEPSALSDDTPISDTDIPAIERDFEAALAEAEADALKAEGYAVGTQDGTPAQSGEPYYQDNAKYYKEQAEAAASGGGADALKAEGYAVGTQNGVPVTSESPYYHNNAAYYEGEASTSATNAAASETNAGLSETAAGNSATSAAADALKSEGWAVGEQNGTPVTSGSPYYHNNAEYYKDQAAQYAAGGLTFQGSVAFASIPTMGMANGDMYNITDDFTTDNRFIEGSGVSVKAGADIAWVAGSVNKWDILALGGGSDDYSQLINKPQINSVELNGNKTPSELGLATDAAMTGASAGSAGAKGLVPAPAAGDQDKVLYGDGTWKAPSGASDMTGATASTPGTHGLVPAPAAGDNTKFLRGDGTWAEAGGGGGGGFDYKDWLTAGDLNPMSYADLAAVLADEKAVRKLMTIHTAVDYLTQFGVGETNIQTILNDNIAAKWINLRDYALDTLQYAFSSLMDSIGKYGFGEWAKLSESPETWGPKGNVPIMTSNTAPYGEVSASGTLQSGYEPYKAFDGDNSTQWSSNNSTGDAIWIAYKFTNPVCVKRLYVYIFKRVTEFDVEGSNDGVNYTFLKNVQTGLVTSNDKFTATIEIPNDNYYMYYRITSNNHFTDSSKVITARTIQFYGREMKVSVPVMTSNTAPYGEASASVEAGANSAAWKAFDGIETTTAWGGSNTSGTTPKSGWLRYQFPHIIKPKFIRVITFKGDSWSNGILKGSVDGSNFDTIQNFEGAHTGENYLTNFHLFTSMIETDATYKYLEFDLDMFRVGGTSSYTEPQIFELQFYGFDYSEYDWDADNPRHYLYDHGVEVNGALTAYDSTNTGNTTKGSSYLEYSMTNGNGYHVFFSPVINLSNYNIVRLCTEYVLSASKDISGNYQNIMVSESISASRIAITNVPKADTPNNAYLDISAISGNYYVGTGITTGSLYTFNGACNELWLE